MPYIVYGKQKRDGAISFTSFLFINRKDAESWMSSFSRINPTLEYQLCKLPLTPSTILATIITLYQDICFLIIHTWKAIKMPWK